MRNVAREKKIYEKAYPVDDLIIESIISIGEVRIIPGKEGLEPWENDRRRLLNRKDIGDAARQALAEYFQKLINGIMGDQDKSYVVVKIEAERLSDTDEALQKADRALDILRLMQFRYGKHPSGYTGFSIHSSVRSHLLESIMRSNSY